nr:CIH_HP1_G0004800.mRNA.1.CDS.1 [Saccharomyces cerevisiae]
MPYSPSFILILHTHTDATVYIISNLPYSHILLQSMAHLSLNQFPNALTSLCTVLASAVYTLYHFTHKAHDYPHFNIYISFGDSKYCITALNTYVIPLSTIY